MTELIRDLKESLVNPEGDFVEIPRLDKSAHTVMLSREEVSRIKNSSLPSYNETLNTGAADSFFRSGKCNRRSQIVSLQRKLLSEQRIPGFKIQTGKFSRRGVPGADE